MSPKNFKYRNYVHKHLFQDLHVIVIVLFLHEVAFRQIFDVLSALHFDLLNARRHDRFDGGIDVFPPLFHFLNQLCLAVGGCDFAGSHFAPLAHDLSSLGDTLVGRAERIRELGAKASKSLPPELLDEGEIKNEG